VEQTKDLIRGFENVAKLVDSLSQVLGTKKLNESIAKKTLDENFFPADLPELKEDKMNLHEDFEVILGIKKASAPKHESPDFKSLKSDALALIENLKSGKISEDEAHQVLTFMTESLDGAVESVIKENKKDDKECVICGRQTEHKEMDHHEDMVPVCDDQMCLKSFKREMGESVEKVIKVKLKGYDYDLKITDSTHFVMKDVRDERWGIPMHVQQLYPEVKKQLQDMGYMTGDGYFVWSESVSEAAMPKLDPMTRHYLVTMLWAELDQTDPNSGGDPLDKNFDISDIDEESVAQAKKDCDEFYKQAEVLLGKHGIEITELDPEMLGRDFWLSRNGHGAGFFDAEYLDDKEARDEMQDLARNFREKYPFITGEVGEEGTKVVIESHQLHESKQALTAKVKELEFDIESAMEEKGIKAPGNSVINTRIVGYEEAHSQKEEDGKTYHYPELIHFNIESWDTIKLSMTGDGRIFKEGQTISDKAPGVPRDALIDQVLTNVMDWSNHVSKLKDKKQESSNPETRNMSEADPSLQAPKRWWNKMVKQVKGDDPAAIVGRIWADLPDEKKKEIRAREGKKYGPAESVTEGNNPHVGAHVTLDGKPAIISNADATGKFAKVSQTPSGVSVEFSWDAVDRIMKKGGEFKSGPKESVQEAAGDKTVVKIAYEIITPESAEQGDVAEHGWHDECECTPDEVDVEDGLTCVDLAVKCIKDQGSVEASSSVFHQGIWYTTIDPERDYQDGSETYYSFHLHGFTPEQEKEVHEKVTGKGPKGGKHEDAMGGGSYPPGEQRAMDLINQDNSGNAEMAKADLVNIHRKAQAAHDLMKEISDVPAWVIAKMAMMKSGMNSVIDYVAPQTKEGNKIEDKDNKESAADSLSNLVRKAQYLSDLMKEVAEVPAWVLEKLAMIRGGVGAIMDWVAPQTSENPMKEPAAEVEGADVAYVPGTARAMRGIPEAKQEDVPIPGDQRTMVSAVDVVPGEMRGMIAADKEKIRALKPKKAKMSAKVGEETIGLEEANEYVEPRVYVGTYGKYAGGSIEGKWLNLEDYADKEDFLKACAELHKDEADPELMFQDFEGFPEEYYSESSISDELWDWLELDEEDRELLAVYQDKVLGGKADIDQAREAFAGKAKSESDWVYDHLEDMGGVKDMPEESLVHYLTLSDTDIRVMSNDDADAKVRDLSDEEMIEQADMYDEFEKAVQAEELQDELDDLDAEKDADRIKEIKDELAQLGEVRSTKQIIDAARDEVLSKAYDEIKEMLEKDPVGYFEDMGYKPYELVKNNIMSFDYDAYARDLEIGGDYTFVHKDGEVWVFSNH
jgi:antirestriction protein/predicted RNA binding protein with dsRBD fold (UPF0201 family)